MTDSIPQNVSDPGVPPEGSSESRGWAVGAHLSPWIGGFVGPLIIWLAKKDDPYVEYHSRGALNFQISLLIYVFAWIVISTLIIVVSAAVATGGVLLGIAIFGLGFLAFMYLGFVPPIVGAIRASNGDAYRYPLSIGFVKAPRGR